MFETTAQNLIRLMPCKGFRFAGNYIPATPETNIGKAEGEAAHYMAKAVWNKQFTIDQIANTKAPNGFFVTHTMVEHVAEYLNTIANDAADFNRVDLDVSFTGTDWRVSGRIDHVALTGSTLYIDNFCYGYGIVEPTKNWEMIAWAIGFCITAQKQPETIVFSVYQPRAIHPEGQHREWAISYKELISYYHQIGENLATPSQVCSTGNHCRHCPALSNCNAARVAAMNAVDVSEYGFSDKIANDALAHELDLLARASAAIEQRKKALENLALHEIKNGAVVPNYSLERSYGNRQWNEGLTPEFVEMITGKQNLAVRKLISPAQVENAGVDKSVVKSLSKRLETGVKLVRVSAETKAKRMFDK